VVDRLKRVDNPLEREAAYLDSITDHLFKVSLPAGSFWCLPWVFHNGVTEKVYENREELRYEIIALERQQIDEAIAAGCKYIQLDFPMYPLLVDQRYVAGIESLGIDMGEFLTECIEADRKIIEGLPDDVIVGLHLCRGNYREYFLATGSIEPVAERMFNELPYDVFLVEWHNQTHSGGFDPIRFVPPGPTVSLGIVSTKDDRVQPADELVATMEQASKFLDVSQLSIAPSCGFASAQEGNPLTEEQQYRKLEEMVAAADRIWTPTKA
jgi:5-methyltetrahydropteroyltriglutamate--homocysteine methyltransferase